MLGGFLKMSLSSCDGGHKDNLSKPENVLTDNWSSEGNCCFREQDCYELINLPACPQNLPDKIVENTFLYFSIQCHLKGLLFWLTQVCFVGQSNLDTYVFNNPTIW